jgi:hypothetical protein
MKFDFTKNVELEPAWKKAYLALRILLYLLFIFSAIYILNRILFPPSAFYLDLKNSGNKENSLEYEKSSFGDETFSAYSRENFSTVDFQAIAKKNDSSLIGKQLSLRRTFKAFAYPTSEKPTEFPNGNLLNSSGKFFIVSDGKLRQFASIQIISSLGYSEESFQDATAEELGYSEKGEIVTDTQNYPDDSLFLISDTYYKLSSGTLTPFTSEKAFLSYFEKNQALSKDEYFLQKYNVDQDNPIGFANGTLLSFDTGVFLVDNGKVVPFNNPETFLALGYHWEDIIPANEGEIGLYQRDKIFSINRPHPDGTIFFAQDSNKYYLVSGQNKKEIKGDDILKIYLKRKPVVINEKSLDFQTTCTLQKKLWPFNFYKCNLSVEILAQSPGNDFQFKAQSPSHSSISAVNIVFSKKVNWVNLRDALSVIKQRFLTNFGYATTN